MPNVADTKERRGLVGENASNSSPLNDDWKKQVIQEAERELLRYHEMTILSAMNVPKITSGAISDMPVHRSSEFHSSTEKTFEKKQEALEWLDVMKKTLDKMPYECRNFIDCKYLGEPSFDKGLQDSIVMDKLQIHRNYYYKLKPKSLYLFGILLKSNKLL